jgi:membrane-associated protease RseP (regulator of RpoE activity)
LTVPREERKRFLVSAGLFLLTFLTVLFLGTGFQLLFDSPRATVSLPSPWSQPWPYVRFILFRPQLLLRGLPYAFSLMGILLAHELGHFFACRFHGLDATPPYFIPAPTLFGTFGAFIRIRSPFSSKQALFDVGVAGPLAGFLAALPVLAVGIHLSRLVEPVEASAGSYLFGEPLLFSLMTRLIQGAPAAKLALDVHPVAFAGWFGLLATAFNLFPIGQLDGGHILYSVLGKRAYPVGVAAVLTLLVLGVIFWNGWLLWALLVTLIGLRHPPVFAYEPLDNRRRLLALAALLIFVLSFTPAPIQVAF